jgi:hypothetical protein
MGLVAFWPVRLAAVFMRRFGLVATQMPTLLFAGVAVSAARTAEAHGRPERVFQVRAGGAPVAFAPLRRWIARCS